MIHRVCRSAALAALLIAMPAMPLAAQSLSSIRGLGYPILPTDARAQVLGGLGIGLKGLALPMVNPAAAAGVARRGASVSVAAVEQEAALGGGSDDIGATRFPLIQVLYPVRGVVVTVGYGGYLDQGWAVVREGEQGSGDALVSFRDFVGSSGGIGQFQLGAAVPVSSNLAVGGAIGALTGNQRFQFQRVFDETTTTTGSLEPFVESRSVSYFGPMAQLGVRWDPLESLRLAGSLTWAGTLEADSSTGPAVSQEYDLPLQMAGGVSANLAPSLLATVSGRWSGWSSVGEVLGTAPGLGTGSTGQDTWEVGGGLEWETASPRATRTFPVRLGGQYRQLPFTFGDRAPTEWFVGAGVGMRVGPTGENPLATVDLTAQRGERTALAGAGTDELVETAWRFTLSLSVFGN